jgi:hypothetical protein
VEGRGQLQQGLQCSAVQCSAVQCSAVQCSAHFSWVLYAEYVGLARRVQCESLELQVAVGDRDPGQWTIRNGPLAIDNGPIALWSGGREGPLLALRAPGDAGHRADVALHRLRVAVQVHLVTVVQCSDCDKRITVLAPGSSQSVASSSWLK